MKQRMKIGNGFDVHAFGDGNSIVLGGITIPHSRGLIAHSDGDVLIHSLCDALLGSCSLGDIGKHFPDTSEEFKGIASTVLLSRCCEMVSKKGYTVQNIDCTVLAEAPKLRPYIDSIRANLSMIMNLAIDDISVKATTTERLGFVGREEGIAVLTTTLISK